MGDYYWYKTHGVCVDCHAESADRGKTRCWRCRAKNEALRLWNSLSERNKGIAMVLMETVGTLAVNIARMEAIAGSEAPARAERKPR